MNYAKQIKACALQYLAQLTKLWFFVSFDFLQLCAQKKKKIYIYIYITTNFSYKWTCLALSFCTRKKISKKWETEEFQIPTILFFPLSVSDNRKRSYFSCNSRKPNKVSIFFHFLALFFLVTSRNLWKEQKLLCFI